MQVPQTVEEMEVFSQPDRNFGNGFSERTGYPYIVVGPVRFTKHFAQEYPRLPATPSMYLCVDGTSVIFHILNIDYYQDNSTIDRFIPVNGNAHPTISALSTSG
jgi:hypothetical protein